MVKEIKRPYALPLSREEQQMLAQFAAEGYNAMRDKADSTPEAKEMAMTLSIRVGNVGKRSKKGEVKPEVKAEEPAPAQVPTAAQPEKAV